MKILMINTLYHPYKVGGAEVSVQLLAEELVRQGHIVRVACLHNKNKKFLDTINGVEVVYLPLVNKYWPFGKYQPTKFEKILWHILDNYNPSMAQLIENELMQFKPDIVHTNNITGFSVAIWSKIKKANIPLVHTSRDYYLFNPNTTLFRNGKNQDINSIEIKLWSFVKKRLSKKVDYYVGISDFIREFHINNGFFSNKVKSCTIYNPVEKIKKIKNRTKILNIGFIGRLMTEKGFDVFCDFAEKNGEKYTYYVAGIPANNEESKFLYERAKKLNIVLLGHVNFSDFIEKVDAVILPIKWNEPFGRVVVECALAGIKVYVSKKGGVIELIPKFNNISVLGKDLNITDEYNANDNVLEENEFDATYHVERYLNIYGEILNAN